MQMRHAAFSSTHYTNPLPDGVVRSLEYAPDGEKARFFIRTNSAKHASTVKQWLHDTELPLQVVSQTNTEQGALLVAEGTCRVNDVLSSLHANGEYLHEPTIERASDPWKWRAILSATGQGFQLVSGLSNKESKSDAKSMIGFAAFNMTANLMNWIFGGQEKKDPNQLRYLKQQLNAQLAPIAGANALPAVDDARMGKRPAEDQHKTTGQKAYDFLQRHSVSVGEIGLRVVGSTMLVFSEPLKGIKTLWQTRSPTAAFQVAKNPTRTFYAGIGMLAGKFVSLLAKEPDPYGSETPSLWRRFQEKVAFPLSSVIEGTATTYMGLDRVGLMGPRAKNDYLGAAGNASFLTGYIIRFRAPYGTLHVDMPELYAHVSDSLAALPREKIAPILAQTANGLAQHFGREHSLAEIYGGIASDLQKQHGITLAELEKAASPSASVASGVGTVVQNIQHKDRIQPTAELARSVS